ncbi:MAG: hypothetical protein Q4B09_08380 [Lachnospiraceae bacterium]|nr:hypothetical protein [Lachnospiraceae bacterium]
MKRPVLAVLDSEAGYAVSFMEYINRQNKAPFEVRAFTDPEQLRIFLLQHRAAIVLVSEKDCKEEIREWTGGSVMVLTEQRRGRKPNSVFKYQAASEVMRDVMRLYGAEEESRSDASYVREEPGSGFLKRRVRIIGVFSPIGRCMKTAFAMALGQCLAAKKPTVLLNMESCPAYEEIMHTEYETDLGEAIYHIRNEERHPASRILPLMQSIGDMDYLPPFRSMRELCAVSEEEWEQLIGVLEHASTYESIVLDLGEIPLMMPGLLQLCDVIYMPVRQDYTAKAKIRSFLERPLQEDGKDSAVQIGDVIEERLRRLTLSDDVLPLSGDRWFESLPYSRLGRYAEECIMRDQL